MKRVLCLVLLASLAFGQAGLSVTAGLPHASRTDRSGGVYGLSGFLPSSRLPGFHEFGLIAQPFGTVRASALRDRPTWESWGALVTGHLFLWSPWLRPGFHVGPMYGTVVSKVEGRVLEEGRFGAYYALNLQVLFLTLSLSNFSSNIGLNFTL